MIHPKQDALRMTALNNARQLRVNTIAEVSNLLIGNGFTPRIAEALATMIEDEGRSPPEIVREIMTKEPAALLDLFLQYEGIIGFTSTILATIDNIEKVRPTRIERTIKRAGDLELTSTGFIEHKE